MELRFYFGLLAAIVCAHVAILLHRLRDISTLTAESTYVAFFIAGGLFGFAIGFLFGHKLLPTDKSEAREKPSLVFARWFSLSLMLLVVAATQLWVFSDHW